MYLMLLSTVIYYVDLTLSMSNEYEMCDCGHFGGHSPSTHNGHQPHFQEGHGGCNNCECKQFTWVGFCNSQGKLEPYLHDKN